MTARILAAHTPGEVRVAVAEGERLVDFAIWRPGAPDGVGDLHRGRVLARVPALAGAFVAIEGAEGFLPDTEGGSAPGEGTVLGVRVTRAAQGGKGPRLSARLSDAEAALVGTGPPALVRRAPGAVERLAARHEGSPVLTASRALAARLRPVLGARVQVVPEPLWDEPIAAAVEELSRPVVALPQGGRLAIHPTPALTAIDIDIGSMAAAPGTKPAIHAAANAAALPELAAQIRLRDLSGAILVDFAGLSPKRRAALGPALAALLSADPLRPRLLGFTGLGLAEILRARIRPPLHELLAGPHAAGLAGLRRLAQEAASEPGAPRALRAAPAVIAALEADRAARQDIMELTGRPPLLRADPGLAANEWIVETLR